MAELSRDTAHTIDVLEARLRRLQYVVYGNVLEESSSITNIFERLRELEHALNQLVFASKVRQDLVKLYAQNPDLSNTLANNALIYPENSVALPIILAAASTFAQTASSLTSALDMPLPSADASNEIIELRPRITKLENSQRSQLEEVAQLKQRSTIVLHRWYTVDVLQTGDYWANTERKIERTERRLCKVALSRQQDQEIP